MIFSVSSLAIWLEDLLIENCCQFGALGGFLLLLLLRQSGTGLELVKDLMVQSFCCWGLHHSALIKRSALFSTNLHWTLVLCCAAPAAELRHTFLKFLLLHSTILLWAVVHSRNTKTLYLYVLLYPKHMQCKGFPISSLAIVVIIVIFVIIVSNQSGCYTPLNDHHQLFQRQLNFWNWAQQDPHSPFSPEEPFS